MKLRTQLIFVSLLTLALPWAGCEYIREMENTLRQGQAQGLLTTTRTIAHVLSHEDKMLFQHEKLNPENNRADNNIYTFLLDGKPRLDGYADDWGHLKDDLRYFNNQQPSSAADNSVGFIAGRHKKFVYFFIQVKDNNVIYHNPSQGFVNGDRLQLLITQKNGTPRKYFLQTSAPGKITASYITAEQSLNPVRRKQHLIQGQWQDTAEGYNIEIRIPDKLIPSNINFSVVDIDQPDTETSSGWYGSWDQYTSLNNGVLIQPSQQLASLLAKLKQENARLRIADMQGWLLASAGSPHRQSATTEKIKLNETLLEILTQLYRFIMNTPNQATTAIQLRQGKISGTLAEQALANQSGTSWYKPEKSNNAIVSAAHPVIIDNETVAIVIADQNSDAILTLTSQALSRLISLSSIAIFVAVFSLLVYATYLSMRIRKLRDISEQIISAEGTIGETFKPSKARDELGDLSRSFATMHQRLAEYTQYLRTLASKLSHELRTPLAVVQSSLDNLASDDLADDKKVYVQRARQGSERLSRIITAMSEASRVEQSILSSDTEIFDLCAVVSSSIAAYKDIYPARKFAEIHCTGDCLLKGSPELIVQLLDKLVDNAVDFSTEHSTINIEIINDDSQAWLFVKNEGSLLPAHMQNQLFDSMVSLRDSKTEQPHLGLGLYIVKLIADAHGGNVSAQNRHDVAGTEFVISFPCIETTLD
ncbi:MAG: proteobacterial dedicated sortase system histidine kinase [Gammaproteobacteria bacterium]|nr:proteobacterial dedicated sortase system histidine kinase [Gammaproteobacteria bacterium]